jgi:hypothetical protein
MTKQDPYWPFPSTPVQPYKEPNTPKYPSDAEEAPV